MSTPGSLSIPSKGTNQSIPATGPVDGGTLLRFVDAEQGINTDRLILPTGDTSFHLQAQFVFDTSTVKRPTWVQVELCRITKAGTVTSYDTTGKSRWHIVQPGTTTFPDIWTVEEFVNDFDGAFGWTVTHNATAPIRCEVDIYKAKNPTAYLIHKLGGQNVMSDGSVSDKAWK